MKHIKEFNEINENKNKKLKCFLGGTCADSTWREDIIKKLKIDYFNPVVKNWDSNAKERELKERETSDFLLYVITPKMKGVYSIAEVTEDAVKQPEKTIFCFLKEDMEKDEKIEFSKEQINSLKEVGNLVERNGAQYLKTLDEVIKFLNDSE